MDKSQASSESSRMEYSGNQGTITRFRHWVQGSNKRVPLLYLATLALAETTTTLVEPRLGMAMHGICLVSLILHATLYSRGREQHFLLGLSLSPLIRLLSLTLPLSKFPYIYWYMVIGLPLLLATIIMIRATHLTRAKIGVNMRMPFWQLLIGATGIIFGYVEYHILHPEPVVAALRIDLILMPALILLVFTGFLEELIFRGVFQYFTVRNLGRWGLFYVALVFSVLHIGYRSVLDMVFVFFVALFFGFAAQRTGSILGVTLSHGITNIVLFLIIPFLVSIPPTVLETQELHGIYSQPRITTPIIPVFNKELEPETPTEQPTSHIPITGTALPATVITASLPTLTQPLPPQPTPTPSPGYCTPPAGWMVYTVQPGDSLFSISQTYGVSVAELQEANCLGSSTTIWAGQQIYVPYRATATLSQTDTPKPSPTPTVPSSPTPTQLPSSTLAPSLTLVDQPTETPTPTGTPTQTSTAPQTGTSTPTSTSTPAHTPTPTSTPSPTRTEVPTDTPVD